MNNETLHELTEHAQSLAYQAILHSGLYKELPTNADHDRLATLWGEKLWRIAEAMCDEELTRLEQERS